MKTIITKKDGMKILLKGYHINSAQLDDPDPHKRVIDVECKLIKTEDGQTSLKVMNGVTGYEQWNIDGLFKRHKDRDGDFIVCAGTLNRWARMAINESEWDFFVKQYKGWI